jgi:nucleoid-associated protein YgaU
MALTPLKVLLFLGGGTAAAGATAYVAGVLDPYLYPKPPVAEAPAPETSKLAALPPSTESGAKPAAPAEAKPPPPGAAPADAATAPATGAPDDTGAQPPATQQPAAQMPDVEAPVGEPTVRAPAFDLVRVEADGSIVIAGNAAAKAKVEAVIGSRVIGSAVAGDDGGFAIVLDEPLKPGDYQIVLRSTTPDNVVATSEETAVVSVPETPDGQVLALVEQPGKPSELITVPAPPKPDEQAKPSAEAPAASGEEPKPEETASAPAQAAPAASEQQKPSAGDMKVAVEAVEIEGRKIFVAGSSDPGRLVRAYANETLLGETTASAAGRFLVETERDLPVGDYIIRVDALAPDGSKVVARAAVPFEREAGENIAAVAPVDQGVAAADKQAKPTAGADQAATQGQPETAATSDVPMQAPADGTASDEAAAAKPKATAGADAGPAQSSATQSSDDSANTTVSSAQQPAQSGDAPPVAGDQPAQSTGSDIAAAPADQPASGGTTGIGSSTAVTTAPKLESVDGSVIIRRGDSLWRISKRVYGRGVRYSHIYLANQQQIRDPDLIMPGQVFRVPSKSDHGEAADMTKLGEQAVMPETKQE